MLLIQNLKKSPNSTSIRLTIYYSVSLRTWQQRYEILQFSQMVASLPVLLTREKRQNHALSSSANGPSRIPNISRFCFLILVVHVRHTNEFIFVLEKGIERPLRQLLERSIVRCEERQWTGACFRERN